MKQQDPIEEYVTRIDGIEQCPECGHIWCDEGECHYHDCRYFSNEDEEDPISDESADFEFQPMSSRKIVVKHTSLGMRRA